MYQPVDDYGNNVQFGQFWQSNPIGGGFEWRNPFKDWQNLFSGNITQSADETDSIVARNSPIDQKARELGVTLNSENLDYFLSYILNEQASENAWNRSVFSAQNQYQWLVDDLKKAGLSPWLAVSGLNSASAQSSGQSVGSGSIVSSKNNQKTNNTQLLESLIRVIGTIVGIAIFKKAI